MKSAALLLSLALAIGQSDGNEWLLSPQLAPGLELVYSGTCNEESLQPGVQFQRAYRLENHLFVLSGDNRSWDVAFMTTWSVREPGEEPRFTPASVRLEVAKVDGQGRLKTGPASTTRAAPVGAPPLIETGCFVEAPAVRVARNAFWEVSEEGRPPRSWTVLGVETQNGTTCVKLLGQQQSEDWDRPRADRGAWRRRDTVWLSIHLGVAVRVERTLERRDPARREPSHRSVTTYSLESRLRYPGKLYEDRRQEILMAQKVSEDVRPILRQAPEHGFKLDAMMRKVAFHIDNHPATPYRKAVIHLAHRIDTARKGELLLADYQEEAPVPIGPLRVGQKVPDFVVQDWVSGSSIRLTRLLGRPVLVIYYSPHTETGLEVLRFAAELAAKSGDRLSIMAMAATNDREFARRQHADMKLPFAVLDGNTMRIGFDVEATPRFIVLDGEGYIQASSTGWGSHVPQELRESLRRCANPTPTP